jgi:hypothetical protein
MSEETDKHKFDPGDLAAHPEDLIAAAQSSQAPTETYEAPRYWSIVRKQFRRSWLNRIGFAIIIVTALVAVFAPLLANGVPIYMNYQDKVYFPILTSLWPVKHLNLYPELREADYRELEKKSGAEVR